MNDRGVSSYQWRTEVIIVSVADGSFKDSGSENEIHYHN